MSSASSTASCRPPTLSPTQVEIVSSPLPAWAWGGALLFALATALLLLLSLWASPSMAPAATWMRLVDASDDEHAYVAAKVLAGELQQADIVLLGTSSAREALWPETVLESALLQRGGQRKKIVNLSSAGQTPIEMLFLATLRPVRSGQVYVVFLNFGAQHFPFHPFTKLEGGRFLVAPEHLVHAYPHDGLYPEHWKSRSFRAWIQWHALRQRLQRQVKFRFRSWVRAVVYGVPVPPYQPFGNRDPNTDRTRLIQDAKAALGKNFEANFAYLPRALDLLATALQQRGSRLVIVSSPHPEGELRQAYPAEYARFEAAVRSLESARGVEVYDLNRRMEWSSGDFIDRTHATVAGRDKWSAAFVDWLGR